MRPGYDESPINSLPPVVWALALPMIASEVVFGLAFGNAGYSWIAEVGGFCVGFLLCFWLVPGGVSRAIAALRRR